MLNWKKICKHYNMEYEQKWNFYQLLKLDQSTPISKSCHGHVTINH